MEKVALGGGAMAGGLAAHVHQVQPRGGVRHARPTVRRLAAPYGGGGAHAVQREVAGGGRRRGGARPVPPSLSGYPHITLKPR